ncbi:MAG: HAD family phosphatase, partial [Chloroflexi bacterium]|nr:HAD family phosphatase [Chloroflexota bacterium]
IVSGREGIIKPDRRIYDLAVRRFQVRPEHTLFIDDRADNAAAAAALGFQTHHFSEPARLEAALREAGLI